MKANGTRMGMVGALALGLAVVMGAGCDSAGAGSGLAVTVGELSTIAAAGPTRVQARLAAGGAVHELRAHDEVGHDEHVAGRVAVIDPVTRTLELEDVGVVSWSAGVRFRTREESRVSEGEWLAAVAAARARGEVLWVRADRARSLPVLGPMAQVFVANELRLERAESRAKLEVVIGAEHLDVAGEALTYLGIRHSLRGARLFDDRGRSSASTGGALTDAPGGVNDDVGVDDRGGATDDDDDIGFDDHGGDDDDDDDDDDHGGSDDDDR